MDAHKAAVHTIEEQTGVYLRNYCYCANKENPKYIMFDVSWDGWEKIQGKTYKGEEFEFTISEEAKGTDNNLLEIKVYYKSVELEPEDITEGGRKKYGVISPEGRFFECGYSGHNDLEYWLKQRGLIGDHDDPYDWYGWLKLTGSWMTECEFTFDENIEDFDFATSKSTLVKTNN